VAGDARAGAHAHWLQRIRWLPPATQEVLLAFAAVALGGAEGGGAAVVGTVVGDRVVWRHAAVELYARSGPVSVLGRLLVQ
jgi:hypothetical protein